MIFTCTYCGYKTEIKEVFQVHFYLREKYGFCKNSTPKLE
jgi:hypothetical protein